MAVRGYRVRTSPASLGWAGALVAFALVSLGLVHHESARSARARIASLPLRPVLLVDLAANREARGGEPLAELETWRAAVASLGREVEVFEGESLIDVDPARYAVWVLPAQERLSDYDESALDGYLARDGGAVLTGGTGLSGDGASEPSLLNHLFPGERFGDPGLDMRRLRVVGRGPLVAGFAPGAELALAKRDAALSTASAGPLAWNGDGTGSALLPGRHRGAPIAWLGFSIAELDDPDDAGRLARNALRFAGREPLLDLRPWPDGRPCAVLVDGDPRKGDSTVLLAQSGPAGGALPEVVGEGADAHVTIPEARPNSEAQGAALLRDLLDGYEQAERMGSIFSLRSERSWRAAQGREALFASVGEELALRGAWFAQPDQLAAWWLARTQVDAELERLAPDTVRVVFRNHGDASARGVTARVYVPAGASSPRLVSGPVFARRPQLRLAADHAWIEVIARPLDPGAEVSYILRF